MKKQTYIIVFIIAALTIALAYILYPKPANHIDDDQLIGGQRDENGCLVPAGYSWCEAKRECIRFWEEKCDDDHVKDEVDRLLEVLRENTRVALVSTGSIDFRWNNKQGSTTVSGYGFKAEEISNYDYLLVREFFASVAFHIDEYNYSPGAVSGTEGFRKAITVCLLSHTLSDIDSSNPLADDRQGDEKNIELQCGLLEAIKL